MKKQKNIFHFRANDKLFVYLKKLGFIDGRSGNLRKEGPDLSPFINQCLIYVLETGKHGYSASQDELLHAWLTHEKIRIGREWEKVGEKFHALGEEINDLEVKMAKQRISR